MEQEDKETRSLRKRKPGRAKELSFENRRERRREERLAFMKERGGGLREREKDVVEK